MSGLREIERAVEKLSAKDLAKLSAWMDRHLEAAGEHRSNGTAAGGAKWFEAYMACPHPFEIPRRKKQFYRPRA